MASYVKDEFIYYLQPNATYIHTIYILCNHKLKLLPINMVFLIIVESCKRTSFRVFYVITTYLQSLEKCLQQCFHHFTKVGEKQHFSTF